MNLAMVQTCRPWPYAFRFSYRYKSDGVLFKKQLEVKDIPGPKGLPIIGNTLSYLWAGHTERHHEYIDSLHKKYGSIIRTKIGSINAIYVNDPELMRTVFFKLEGKYPNHILPEPWLHYNKLYGCKRGLLFMEGQEWLQYRRILNQLLLQKSDNDQWIEESIKAAVSQLILRWKKNADNDFIVPDLNFEMYRFSIEAMVSLLWGTGYEKYKQSEYETLMPHFSNSVQKIFKYSAKMYVLPAPLHEKLGSSAWKGFVRAVDTSMRLGSKIVDEILDGTVQSDGLLYRLLKENLKKEDVKRIAVDFILAAGDTTAITAQWTLYLLSKHFETVDLIRSQGGKEKNWSKSSQIKATLKESMRLYPVAPFIARFLPTSSMLGDYMLNAGTLVVLSTYTSGRDSRNFYSPDEFLPQRWTKLDSDSDRGAHVPYATLPFAMGARSCIGKKIAMFQLSELIGSIVDSFDLRLLNESEVKLVMRTVSVPSEAIAINFKILN